MTQILFQIRLHKFDAVFIDAFHSSIDAVEKYQFERNVDILWKFSSRAKPFVCKDIKAALNDLLEARQSISILRDELRRKDEEIEG